MKETVFGLMTFVILACNSSEATKENNMSDANAKTDTAAKSADWVALFDGKSTKGWHSYGKSAAGRAWKVEDGALRLDAASKKDWQTAEGGDIVTDEEFDNFHLKLEWKISPKGNSGIIFYVHEDTAKYRNTYETGPEMQVLDNGTATSEGHSDSKLPSHRAGSLYDLIPANVEVKPAGEWNATEIIADKGKLEFYLNGQKVISTTMWNDNWKAMVEKSKFKTMPGFASFKKGKIALQDHGNDVWYRNIMIKKL